jgi:hypothetical protein
MHWQMRLFDCQACVQHVCVRYPQLFLPDMMSAPGAYILTRFVFNRKDQRVLAHALQDLHSEREALLARQPPQQPPPQQQQQQAPTCCNVPG